MLLSSPVTAIRQDDRQVQVIGDRFRVTAARAVVTLQPQLCCRIDFGPALDGDRIALQEVYLMARLYTAKIYLVYF